MGDINKHSFIGPDDDGKGVYLGDVSLEAGTNWASAIKVTGQVQDLTISADTVPGGHDACVDINNRVRHVGVTIYDAVPHGEFAATIKGGARDVRLTIRKLHGHGKVADVITDDWSDQSHDSTAGIELDITTADGSPVTVLALKAPPAFVYGSGPYKFLFPWPWLNPRWLGYPCAAAFEILRRWGLFRSSANT